MKANRIISLLLVLVMCAALVLTSCQKVTKADVEKDPAKQNAEAVGNTLSSLSESFPPAGSVDSAKDAGTVEITWKNDEIGIDLSGLFSYDKNGSRVCGDLNAKFGDSEFGAQIVGDGKEYAVSAPKLFDGAYGFSLETLAEDIRKSELLEKAGLDVEEFADAIEKILKEKEKAASGEKNALAEEFEEFRSEMFAEINKLDHTVEKKEVSSGGKSVKAIVTTFKFDSDAICDILEALIDNGEDLFDKIVEVSDNELFEELGIDAADTDYDDLVADIEDFMDDIAEEDVEGELVLALDPKTAEVLKVDFSLDADDGGIEGTLDLGQKVENFSKITGELTFSSKDSTYKMDESVEFTFTRKDESDKFSEELEVNYIEKSAYSVEEESYSASYGDKNDLTVSISFEHDKKDKTYDLEAEITEKVSYDYNYNGQPNSDTSEMSAKIGMSGALEYGAGSVTFGLDSLTIESDGEKVCDFDDFGLTVKITSGAKSEKVPEYKNVFKLTEADANELSEEIEKNAEEFADDLEDLAEAIGEYFEDLGGSASKIVDYAEGAANAEP